MPTGPSATGYDPERRNRAGLTLSQAQAADRQRREAKRYLALETVLRLHRLCERAALGCMLAAGAVLVFAANDPFANVNATYGLVLLLGAVAGGLFYACHSLARQALVRFGHDVHHPAP